MRARASRIVSRRSSAETIVVGYSTDATGRVAQSWNTITRARVQNCHVARRLCSIFRGYRDEPPPPIQFSPLVVSWPFRNIRNSAPRTSCHCAVVVVAGRWRPRRRCRTRPVIRRRNAENFGAGTYHPPRQRAIAPRAELHNYANNIRRDFEVAR